ncbi:MAG: hypothetical protein EOL90_10395 [Spartobacteria bacterium]|nr:hypothetical protein [Spartobacteria bacterium]
MWKTEPYIGFENQYKKFIESHECEAKAAMNNVETYLSVLQATGNIARANMQPFVHPEPEGMIAIDQRGVKIDKKHGKLKATRLYVYAAIVSETVYLLGIGDKDSQRLDIQNCRKKAQEIKKGEQNG